MNEKEEDFISTVSHELRTPLTSIRGFSQTMLASWDKLDDNSKKKFLKIIEEQSNRLIHLVENMLSVSKIKSQHYIYNNTDIVKSLEKVVSLVKTQYQNQNFKIKTVGKIPEAFVDVDKLEQVFVNLIENSAKYSVESNDTNILVIEDGNFVKIEISNQGPEIREEDYDKIFTKFSRLDNPLTRKVQGSGLGLYITKNIVENMDGKIYVKSEKNSNSKYSKITFELFLPIKNIEEQARIKCNQ